MVSSLHDRCRNSLHSYNHYHDDRTRRNGFSVFLASILIIMMASTLLMMVSGKTIEIPVNRHNIPQSSPISSRIQAAFGMQLESVIDIDLLNYGSVMFTGYIHPCSFSLLHCHLSSLCGWDLVDFLFTCTVILR
jgi:hypothetical protein